MDVIDIRIINEIMKLKLFVWLNIYINQFIYNKKNVTKKNNF